MIDKLEIKNFMPFEELTIPTLKRINLIGGKNNAGKTALLEAIRILNSKQYPGEVITDVLKNRNQTYNVNRRALKFLFNRNSLEQNATANLKINDLSVSIDITDFTTYHFSFAGKEISVSLSDGNTEDLVFISFTSDFKQISRLWDKVVLTPKEDDVIAVIKDTIEPKLKRFDVGQHIVKIRLSDTLEPVPIGTLGDGVQRILLMALGLANAQNSILLIDEIELGLHHSVMEKLWGMIFKYAKKWNIQVFATTHSQDAIRTFQYVASEEEYKNEAQFLRLQVGRKGNNEAIIFDSEKLANALGIPLEIR